MWYITLSGNIDTHIMKPGILFSLGFLVGVMPSYSIDRPAENEGMPAPPPLTYSDLQTSPEAAKTVRVGVVPSAVPQALVAQLELDGFPGVLVNKVIPGSPAEKIGIAENDVIVKLGDTSLAGPHSMAQALEGKVPGEKIAVVYYHKGKKLNAELVLDDVAASAEELSALTDAPAPAEKERAVPARRAIPGRVLSLSIGPNGIQSSSGGAADAIQHVQQIMNMMMSSSVMDDQMMQRLNLTPGATTILKRLQGLNQRQMPPMGNVGGFSHGCSTMHMSDSRGTIEVSSSSAGGTNVRVTDPDGNVLYSGPYNTDKEKEAVPPAVRERLKSVLESNFFL